MTLFAFALPVDVVAVVEVRAGLYPVHRVVVRQQLHEHASEGVDRAALNVVAGSQAVCARHYGRAFGRAAAAKVSAVVDVDVDRRAKEVAAELPRADTQREDRKSVV